MFRESIVIDRSRRRPVHQQIADGVEAMVGERKLRPGERLPVDWKSASLLRVNRNTVAQAYGELERRGVVASRVGSGTFVREPDAAPREPARDGVERGTLEHSLSRRTRSGPDALARLSTNDDAPLIEFGGLVADSNHFPLDDFRAVADEAMAEMGPGILDYGSREGYPPLRAWLAARLREQGAAIDEDEIFILGGSQQGLDLVSKLLLDRGDRLVVESPTYHNAIGVFQLYEPNSSRSRWTNGGSGPTCSTTN